MSVASLLNYPDTTSARAFFDFEHAQDHRTWLSVWGNNRVGLSTLPYWLPNSGLPDKTDWRLRHQQAHNDTLFKPASPIGPFSAPIGQNIRESGPTDPDKMRAAFWTFANHHEHFLVADNIAQNQPQIFYPF
jgi:hypothetical protein